MMMLRHKMARVRPRLVIRFDQGINCEFIKLKLMSLNIFHLIAKDLGPI